MILDLYNRTDMDFFVRATEGQIIGLTSGCYDLGISDDSDVIDDTLESLLSELVLDIVSLEMLDSEL